MSHTCWPTNKSWSDLGNSAGRPGRPGPSAPRLGRLPRRLPAAFFHDWPQYPGHSPLHRLEGPRGRASPSSSWRTFPPLALGELLPWVAGRRRFFLTPSSAPPGVHGVPRADRLLVHLRSRCTRAGREARGGGSSTGNQSAAAGCDPAGGTREASLRPVFSPPSEGSPLGPRNKWSKSPARTCCPTAEGGSSLYSKGGGWKAWASQLKKFAFRSQI